MKEMYGVLDEKTGELVSKYVSNAGHKWVWLRKGDANNQCSHGEIPVKVFLVPETKVTERQERIDDELIYDTAETIEAKARAIEKIMRAATSTL